MLDFAEPDRVAQVRTELRGLVEQLVPHDFLGAFTASPADFEVTERFCRELGRRRLLTAAWPQEFGGSGADVWEQTAVREEMWAAHEPRGPQYMGVNWIGPVVMTYGTSEQQAMHLPPIAAGEIVWCQGFSEPEAGSDLASLRTRATKVDGGWRINGQKVWTSYAGMSQWCFLLARTGELSSRKRGITVFLVDMSTPGIEVRPISALLGPHHLNEVYFTDVFVPDSGVLGEVDDGWSIVTAVLGFERIGIARYARCERLLDLAPVVMGDAWDALPESIIERWARALVRTRQARLLAYRLLDRTQSATPTVADAALYRIAVTTLDQEVGEVLMEIAGDAGLGTTDRSAQFAREVEDHWRYSQASTVASGTVEMNRIAVARHLVRR